VVAVAEKDPVRRASFAADHGIAPELTFADWRDLAAAGRVADGVIVATQDADHADPAVSFADLGYHILLEKPMATSEADCLRIRGNWRREAESGPMLLTKSCHDIDWIMYVMGEIPARVSSFGRLTHFRPEHRPAGATDNCLDCPVEPDCPYSAPRLYLSCLGDPEREHWPLSPVTHERTTDGVLTALRDGPYGRCVYACDNDVVDHQVVNLEFPSGATGSFTMTAFTPYAQRQTRIFGTRGGMEGDGRRVAVRDFVSGAVETFETGTAGDADGGHDGADDALADAFIAALAGGDAAALSSDARESLAGHRVVWAAEEARRTGTVIDIVPTDRTKGPQHR
jgi:predicted dehydrogenase